ncbi:MAG: hypothetical protein PUG16_00285 [Lachnospiraceae bacterium]|jgi:pyruvate,water dikinase|nr:hypothetical protein [Lachnospiraceae bacterium]
MAAFDRIPSGIPELSYGSHFFQDLVESGIGNTAVFDGDSALHFHPEQIMELPDCKKDFLDEEACRDPAFDAVRIL